MSQNKMFSILPFYDSLKKQNHNKWWNYEKSFSLIAELDTLPPFQIKKEATGDAVTGLTLVNRSTGQQTDILSKATSSGLNVMTFDDYDLVIFPSSLPLGLDNPKMGSYYLRINLSGTYLYSEVFNMCDDVSEFIKIEFYHLDKFCFPSGHIEYTFPFKNFLYIPSDIAKPSVEYEEQVIKREGTNFPIQQITYKLHRFSMYSPEYLIDALQIIRLHDVCNIFYGGYEYDVDELLMNSPKWLEQGNLAVIDFEFKTDTIVVSNARGVSSVDYSATLGTCLVVDHNCVALIIKDSVDYNNFQYTPANGGTAVALQAGQSVLIKDTIAKRIELFDFSTSPNQYEQQSVLPFDVAYDANENSYYFAPSNETDNVLAPFISSVTNTGSNGLVFGESFENTLVEVWVKFTDTDGIVKEEKRGQGLSAKLQTTGVPFIYDDDVVQVQIIVSSAMCSLFSQSAWFTITTPTPSGIGSMIIEFDNIVG